MEASPAAPRGGLAPPFGPCLGDYSCTPGDRRGGLLGALLESRSLLHHSARLGARLHGPRVHRGPRSSPASLWGRGEQAAPVLTLQAGRAVGGRAPAPQTWGRGSLLPPAYARCRRVPSWGMRAVGLRDPSAGIVSCCVQLLTWTGQAGRAELCSQNLHPNSPKLQARTARGGRGALGAGPVSRTDSHGPASKNSQEAAVWM